MCGIAVCAVDDSYAAAGREAIKTRGPNHLGEVVSGSWRIIASVLHLRHEKQVQPMTVDGNVLAWNGELYQGVDLLENDTRNIMKRLCESPFDPAAALCRVKGPYAFCFYHAESDSLFFGRDSLGRRSLVFSVSPTLRLCSVALKSSPEWNEVQVGCVFRYSNGTLTKHDIHSSPARRASDLHPNAIELFMSTFTESIRRRIVSIPRPSGDITEARISILFSGGIDSMLMARVAHDIVPKEEYIDLIVVYTLPDSPDRYTAINGLLELEQATHRTNYRLIEVSITASDIRSHRAEIQQLLWPKSTVMDFNIGTVFWHGAKAQGRIVDPSLSQHYVELYSAECRYASLQNSGNLAEAELHLQSLRFVDYSSEARVLLIGLGADELFAGYGRHRTNYRHFGPDALHHDLAKDFGRLWERNLGRDDRLVAFHGKEARHPFLDCDLVNLAQSLHLGDICDLTEDLGLGDKKILRQAALRWGLHRSASLQKRAIQFGSRIANRRTKGATLIAQLRLEDLVNPKLLPF